MKNKNFIDKYKKGFSLIETMVAIAILLIAIVGPMTLASNSLVASAIAKDQFIASFLAQEDFHLRNQLDHKPTMIDICV